MSFADTLRDPEGQGKLALVKHFRVFGLARKMKLQSETSGTRNEVLVLDSKISSLKSDCLKKLYYTESCFFAREDRAIS